MSKQEDNVVLFLTVVVVLYSCKYKTSNVGKSERSLVGQEGVPLLSLLGSPRRRSVSLRKHQKSLTMGSCESTASR